MHKYVMGVEEEGRPYTCSRGPTPLIWYIEIHRRGVQKLGAQQKSQAEIVNQKSTQVFFTASNLGWPPEKRTEKKDTTNFGSTQKAYVGVCVPQFSGDKNPTKEHLASENSE